MLAVLFMSSLAALLFAYVCLPAIWVAIMAGDDGLDAYESGRLLVASRRSLHQRSHSMSYLCFVGNPFRESGPPANMAKLILLRQKVSNVNTRHELACLTQAHIL